MAHRLTSRDILALGFMTFCSICWSREYYFSPMVGVAIRGVCLDCGHWFLLTGVGLPVLTVVALAKVGGELKH